ncbi:MAG: hypothetical protein PHX04_05450 [Bacilli bacterium]|nr:hypothetical protein [Bacilli bacterium]
MSITKKVLEIEEMILEYSRCENFINKAKDAYENSNNQVLEHFREITKTIKMPKSAKN